MADVPLSSLTALTTPAAGDLLFISDVSEAADADKSKKITYGEIGLVMFDSPLTNTSYDGDAVTTGTYTIDTSAWGAPTGITVALVRLTAQWAAAANTSFARITTTGGSSPYVTARAFVANISTDVSGIVKCDSNGDFDLVVNGANTASLYLTLLGYRK